MPANFLKMFGRNRPSSQNSCIYGGSLFSFPLVVSCLKVARRLRPSGWTLSEGDLARWRLGSVGAAVPPSVSPGARYLGLDINCGSTGYAVLGADGALLKLGAVDTRGCADVLGRALVIRSTLQGLHVAHGCGGQPPLALWRVGIEEPLKAVAFGKFHNGGLIQLAQVEKYLNYKPSLPLAPGNNARPPPPHHPSACLAAFRATACLSPVPCFAIS